jgi:hypothetical protein
MAMMQEAGPVAHGAKLIYIIIYSSQQSVKTTMAITMRPHL